MWNVIKERKALLDGDVDCNDTEYWEPSTKIQRLCHGDKNVYFNAICQDIEHNGWNMYPRDFL